MNFNETPQFQGDLRRLAKKYRTLRGDLEEFRRVVAAVPYGNSKHFAVLHRSPEYSILKARLFCKTLRGSSLRIVYAYHEQKALLEFIELYFKGDQETEDRRRIERYVRDMRGEEG